MKQAATTSAQKAKALPEPQALSMIASFDRKPANPIEVSGMPTPVMASVPIIIAQKVSGIFFLRPP